jgi:hypothetical protein
MDKLDVPQGTLDLMILTILAREPLHGYGIAQRLAALSHDHFQVNPGSLSRRCTASSRMASSRLTGDRLRTTAGQSITG